MTEFSEFLPAEALYVLFIITSDTILFRALEISGGFWGLGHKFSRKKEAPRKPLVPPTRKHFPVVLLDKGLFSERRIEQSCFPALLGFVVIDCALRR